MSSPRRSPRLRTPSRLAAAAVVAGVLACGGSTRSDPPPTAPEDAGVSSDSPSGADAGAEGDSASCTGACSRVECSALGPDCSPEWACGAPDLCGRASFLKVGGTSSTSSGGGPERYETNGPDTVENARCIVEALRDAKVGRVRWGWGGGVESYAEVVDVVAGRLAFGRYNASFDSPTVKGGWSATPLKPASHFDDCLTAGTVDAYARCIQSALDPCP